MILRWALDDSTESALAAAVNCLHSLLVSTQDEVSHVTHTDHKYMLQISTGIKCPYITRFSQETAELQTDTHTQDRFYYLDR